jgi:hypothetical protein
MAKPTAADGRKTHQSPSQYDCRRRVVAREKSHQMEHAIAKQTAFLAPVPHRCELGGRSHHWITMYLGHTSCHQPGPFCGRDVEVARVQASHQGACWLDLQEPEEGTGRPPYAYA